MKAILTVVAKHQMDEEELEAYNNATEEEKAKMIGWVKKEIVKYFNGEGAEDVHVEVRYEE